MKQFVLILQALILISTAAIGQTTYYVSTTGDDGTGNGTIGNPWQTIQYAIDQSVGGDVIEVAIGTYAETLAINKSITIIGEVNGVERPVIRPSAPPAKHNNEEKFWHQAIISISMITKPIEPVNVSISGIEIDGQDTEYYKYGIRAMGADVEFNDVIIRNIRSTGSVSGIWIDNGSAEITGCTIQNIGDHEPPNGKSPVYAFGVFAESHDIVKGSQDFPIKLTGNTIREIKGDEALGIAILGSANAEVVDNTINVVESTYFSLGILFSSYGSRDENEDVLFQIRDNEVSEIYSTSSSEIIDEAGILTKRGVRLIGGSYGMYAFGPQNAIIENNTCIDIISEESLAMGIFVELTESGEKGVDYQVEVTENEILNVFGDQGNGGGLIGFFEIPSAGIGVIDAGNVLIAGNEIAPDLDDMKGGIFAVGIAIQNPEGQTTVSENTISGLGVGIFGFLTPHIMAEDNTITGCDVGVAMLGQIFFGPGKISALEVAEMISFIEERTGDTNKNGNDFSVELWEFNRNTVTECFFGFYVIVEDFVLKNEEDESKFRAMENIVEQNGFGFLIADNGGLKPKINKNIIRDNDVFSIFYAVFSDKGDRDDADYPKADGRFNFWGSEDPPLVVNGIRKSESQNAVTPNVKYSPWLGAEPGTPSMTYFVDDSGSIQDAIDLAEPMEIIRIFGGEYIGNVSTTFANGVILYPGDSPACVTFTGSFTVTDRDVLRIDIAGTTVCEEYTRLTVLGQVDLDGIALDIRLGFIPTEEGEMFDIIVSDLPIEGKFLQDDEIQAEYRGALVTFSISYDSDPDIKGDYSVTLEITDIELPPVPIGNVALLVAMGLMLLFFVTTGLKKRFLKA